MTLENLQVLILAAGSSTRLGRPKQLVLFKGRTLLQRVVDQAMSLRPRRIVTVLGAMASEIAVTLENGANEVIVNPEWDRGMGSSLKRGLRHLEVRDDGESDAALLICLADQPLIPSRHLQALLELFSDSPDTICTIARGVKMPPAVFPEQAREALLQLPDDRGAKYLLRKATKTVPCEEASFDIDEPRQLQQLQELE